MKRDHQRILEEYARRIEAGSYTAFIDRYETAYKVSREQRRLARNALNGSGVMSLVQYRLKPNAMQTAFIANMKKLIKDGKTKARIFELRCKFSSNITRTLYFFYEGATIVMTNGFVKKTQKTPPSEIDLAKRRRKDYIERYAR